MDLNDFVSQLSSSADWGVIALGYAGGFAADVFYFPGGLPPGSVAGVSSIATFGLKKTIDGVLAELQRRRDRRAEENAAADTRRAVELENQAVLERRAQERLREASQPSAALSQKDYLEQRAKALQKLLIESELIEQAEVLQTEHELWSLGLATESEFDGMIRSILQNYRVRKGPRRAGVGRIESD
jgi:hypothetical protein